MTHQHRRYDISTVSTAIAWEMMTSVPDVSASSYLRRFLGRFSFMSDILVDRRTFSFDLTVHAMETCQPRDEAWIVGAEAATAGRQAVHTCMRF